MYLIQLFTHVYMYLTQLWAPTSPDLQRLRRNGRSMIRWICGVKPHDEISIDLLCARLGIQEVTAALRTKRLRWYEHVVRSLSCINSVTNMEFHVHEREGDQKRHGQIVLRLT